MQISMKIEAHGFYQVETEWVYLEDDDFKSSDIITDKVMEKVEKIIFEMKKNEQRSKDANGL